MQSLVWEAPRRMDMREQADPTPAAGEVIIEVAYAGICGSELSGYLGHNALRVPPLVMGHEFAGTVVATSNAATASGKTLETGQHVAINPMVYCGTCRYCAAGTVHLCANRSLIGASRPGAYARYVAVPGKMVLPLNDGYSLRIAALTEPAAVAVHIGEIAGNIAGDDVLIVGAGPIGLLALQVLLANGARQVFISDLGAERLAMAEQLGGIALDPHSCDVIGTVRDATSGYGAAVAIDAVGTAQTRATCVAGLRSAGVCVFSGLHEETSAVPASDIIRREIVVRGSFCYTPANFDRAIDDLAHGALRLDPWIIEAPLRDGGMWFDRLLEAPGNVAKVLLVPE